MKDFKDFFENIVGIKTALDRIASALETEGSCGCSGKSAPAQTEESKYPDVADRDALLEGCRVRNIDVKKQTKNPTLLKKIMAYDKAVAGCIIPAKERPAPKVEPETTELAPESVPEDPPEKIEEPPVEEETVEETTEPDPLDELEPEILEDDVLTIDELRSKAMMLRKNWLEKNPGDDKMKYVAGEIKAVVRSFGVELLDDLPVEKSTECLAKFEELLAV